MDRIVIGIDVSKDRLDVHVQTGGAPGGGEAFALPNTADAIAGMASRLLALPTVRCAGRRGGEAGKQAGKNTLTRLAKAPSRLSRRRERLGAYLGVYVEGF
jgi:hypothetical protein